MTKPAQQPSKPPMPEFGRADHGPPAAFLVKEASLTKPATRPGKPQKNGKPGKPVIVETFETSTTTRHKAAKLALAQGARAGEIATTAPVEGDANGRHYRKVLHPIESMAKAGKLTSWQAKAGMRLVLAYEATQTTPGAGFASERVDSSSKPDARTAAQIEALDRYARMRRAMPRDSRKVVDHVCCKGLALRCGLARNSYEMAISAEQLRIALDMLASHLQLM